MAESALGVFIPSSQFGTHFLSVAHVEDGLKETMNAFECSACSNNQQQVCLK